MKDREKQIEEMTRDIANICHENNKDLWAFHRGDSPPPLPYHEYFATHLFNAGYRKQREGEWKKTCVPDIYQCTNCKRPTKMDELCDSETLRDFCPNCGAEMKGELYEQGEID